ncbi:transmembrane protease serine 2 [Amyelois transitella]|uniref:transmembrane protease serine 2 n=1 Tax=Amyelois transitella TaxID=680683 RepID=UPI00298FEEF1|nr:transmembrane protease serine 2 [Amyelois transitella]
MRVVFLLGILGLAALVCGTPLAEPEVGGIPLVEPNVGLGYHQEVGIPLAAKIKEQEDRVFLRNSSLDPRIVGGAIAPTNSYPFLAGLIISFVNIDGQSACGSSLVSSSRLVTAAHCWFDGTNQASSYTVVLGSSFLFYGGTRIVTSTVVMHPQWTPSTLHNDIAVIYLPTPVSFSASIQPISLPTWDILGDQFVGEWAVAAGYGTTSDLEITISINASVRHVSLQVITVAQCQASFGFYAQASTICTNGAGGVGICKGDSGGPLVVNRNGMNILVGVSSFVAKDACQQGHPSAFARVTSFFNFILQHILDGTKMRAVILLGFVALVAGNPLVEPEGLLGYHEKIGIPLASSIKKAEDRAFAGRTQEEKERGRIVGGSIAPTNGYPYLAGLVISFVNIAGQSACGSSLISASRLVTAAHCWFDGVNQANSYVVVLGSHFLFYGGTRIVTSTVITHPQWTPSTLHNDVAVIYLPYSVAFSASIQPISLPPANFWNEQFAGEWAIAAGYGLTSDLETSISLNAAVSHVNLQVITVAQCQAVFGFYAQASTICTNGAGGVGICSGDSGGPLVINRSGQQFLVGVSSFVAAAGCQLGFPSAFARITSFQSFIQQHM